MRRFLLPVVIALLFAQPAQAASSRNTQAKSWLAAVHSLVESCRVAYGITHDAYQTYSHHELSQERANRAAIAARDVCDHSAKALWAMKEPRPIASSPLFRSIAVDWSGFADDLSSASAGYIGLIYNPIQYWSDYISGFDGGASSYALSARAFERTIYAAWKIT